MTEGNIKYATHQGPVWRARSDFIVHAEMPDSGEGNIQMEQLWAKKLDDKRFEVCCIPFFLYNLALGDIVLTEARHTKRHVVKQVVVPSGRYVFRLWFGDSEYPRRHQVSEELSKLGALLESSSPNMLAVDAVNYELARRVGCFLEERESLGELVYETGRT